MCRPIRHQHHDHGDSGVGKKFVASLIHQQSRRGRAPLTVFKCSEIPESTLDVRHSLSKTANDGTLLIEKIQKIPEPMQLELLRFIESELPNRNRVRLMTTCSTDLFERVRSNEFSDDLFYRLNVIHLVIPALRDRPEDIPTLFRHYLFLNARAEPPQLTPAAWERLVAYPWPGNVRELKTVAENLAVRNLPRPFEPEDLPPEISRWRADHSTSTNWSGLRDKLDDIAASMSSARCSRCLDSSAHGFQPSLSEHRASRALVS